MSSVRFLFRSVLLVSLVMVLILCTIPFVAASDSSDSEWSGAPNDGITPVLSVRPRGLKVQAELPYELAQLLHPLRSTRNVVSRLKRRAAKGDGNGVNRASSADGGAISASDSPSSGSIDMSRSPSSLHRHRFQFVSQLPISSTSRKRLAGPSRGVDGRLGKDGKPIVQKQQASIRPAELNLSGRITVDQLRFFRNAAAGLSTRISTGRGKHIVVTPLGINEEEAVQEQLVGMENGWLGWNPAQFSNVLAVDLTYLFPAASPIQDCNSCWAQAATDHFQAVLVAMGYLTSSKTKVAPSSKILRAFLSTQQVIECTGGANNCDAGGSVMDAWQWMRGQGRSTDGVVLVGRYPRRSGGSTSSCTAAMSGSSRFRPGPNIAFNLLTPCWAANCPASITNEKTMVKFLQKGMPLVAYVDASEWLAYEGTMLEPSIFPSSRCSTAGNLPISHAVSVVGFGTFRGKQVWMVRNTWGVNWGVLGQCKHSDPLANGTTAST